MNRLAARRLREFLLPLALTPLVLSGCSTRLLTAAAATQSRVEISATPYFPQRDHQCGPAALATILSASGAAASAEDLAHQVYIAGRRGSLQAELLASARRHGRVAYVLDPALPALLQELEQGRPVLALQNFGLASFPLWHYAVVIGYDRERDAFLLRSGRHRRLQLAAARFLGTWRRAGNWAFIALRPGELPADLHAARFLDAIAPFEALGQSEAAAAAYQAAVGRWPAEPLAWFALANNRLARGQLLDAEAAYREVLRLEPNHVPARNNLALLLARRGCTAEARALLEPARSAAAGGPFAAEITDSWSEISALGGTTPAGAASACAPP